MPSPAAIVRVRLPAVLRPLAGGRPELRGEGRTLGEVIRSLGREHPALCERLLDADGRLRRYVTFFLNGDDVRHAGGAEAIVGDGDELTVVPALSGGGAPAAESSGSSGCAESPTAELERVLPALAALAEQTPGEEVCGFVLSSAAGAARDAEVVPVRNVALDRARAFSMDTREVLAVLRAADDRGQAVAAIFHSHPDGGAGLSPVDRAQLAAGGRPLWPGAAQWVIALDGGRVVEVRGHAWAGDRYAEQFRRQAPFTER